MRVRIPFVGAAFTVGACSFASLVSPLGCSSSDSAPPALGDTDGGRSIGTTDATTPQPDASMTPDANHAEASTDASNLPDAPDGQVATCSDHIKDGMETDVDCGGGLCPPCADTLHCMVASDCTSKNCGNNVCIAPTCSDHIKNGAETDVDCGGGTCAPCLVGKACGHSSDCASARCSGGTCLCQGDMVTIPTALTLGGAYCIDPYEVIKKDYNDFWTANPTLGANLPASCAFKTSYTPSNDWPPVLTQGGYNGGEPVHYVDWCDAYAYCAWRGKRLCGAIAGGSIAQASIADRDQDAWYNACSAEGANTWPYGSTYNDCACNGADAWMRANGCPSQTFVIPDGGTNGHVLPLRDFGGTYTTMCQGGAAGLYMMSGDVAEWEDSCDASAGANDNCQIRGGDFTSTQSGLRCDANATATRSTRAESIGFRCCL
jgi:formylglycine-generating enzyme required for sulfatase activity